MPEQFWRLTFNEFRLLIDNYYHKQDLQTIQTREILAMLYNVNRAKGQPKTGTDLMKTYEEMEGKTVDQSEVPNKDIIEKIKKKYGE